jgi:hypothetical protein
MFGIHQTTVYRKLNPCRVRVNECVSCGASIHKISTRCRRCSSAQHSQRCSGGNNSRWKGGLKTVICRRCKKEFKSYYSKFCSWECAVEFRKEHKKRYETICEACDSEFAARSPGRRYCSRECYNRVGRQYLMVKLRNRVGSLCPAWKGGISREPYSFDFSDELKTKVRTRDGYRCAVCKFPGKHVHHIDYNKKNSDLSNLVTLCASCHAVTNYNRDYWQFELTRLLGIRSRPISYPQTDTLPLLYTC